MFTNKTVRIAFKVAAYAILPAGFSVLGGCGLTTRSGSLLQNQVSDLSSIQESTFLVQKDSAVFCFEKFSTAPASCHGFSVQIVGPELAGRERFSGTCEMSGLDGKAQAGTPVSLSCFSPKAQQGGGTSGAQEAASGGAGQSATDLETCFGSKSEGHLLKGQAVSQYSSGVWKINPGQVGGEWLVLNQGKDRSCDQAFKKLECQLRKRNAPAASLALSQSSSTGLADCWQKTGLELSRCLAENADAEIYESGSVAEASKPDGQRRPDRCFSPRPSNEYSVFVYQKLSGDMAGALSERGKVTAHDSVFAADLFYSFSSMRPLPGNSGFGGDYPSATNLNLVFKGSPDTQTGVWRDASGYAVRFLPKGTCDQMYLGQSIRVPLDVSGEEPAPSQPDTAPSGPGGGSSPTPSGDSAPTEHASDTQAPADDCE